MTNVEPLRVVYKSLGKQEIDADLYLPQLSSVRSGAGFPVIINIHGGAFMLGSSRMVNKDQIQDCLDRGWIVIAPNHRLCPQVDLLDGPIQDCRDLLNWIYNGGLRDALSSRHKSQFKVDLDHVFAFGTSSGGTLSLCLGFGVPRPVAGIYDLYGPCNFSHPFWVKKIPHVAATLPSELSKEYLHQVFHEDPIPIEGGVSLEGQAQQDEVSQDARHWYALSQIANGTVINAILPTAKLGKADPFRNITSSFPPTIIIHGEEDTLVPVELSQGLYRVLQQAGVRCDIELVPGEGHTFAAKMRVGSRTWNLQRKGFEFLESLLD